MDKGKIVYEKGCTKYLNMRAESVQFYYRFNKCTTWGFFILNIENTYNIMNYRQSN